MRRGTDFYTAAAAAAALGLSSVAVAGVSSQIEWREAYEDNTSTDGTLEGTGYIQYRRPGQTASSANTRAYVDPLNHRVGAYAIADTTHRTIATPGNIPVMWQKTDTTYALTDAGFTDRLVVGAGSSGLSAGDQVRLKVQVQLHGRVEVGNPRGNDGHSDQRAEAFTSFTITDPTATEDSGEGSYGQPLVDVFAEASVIQGTTPPNPTNPYVPVNGLWSREFESYWSASANTLDEDLWGESSDSLELDYPDGPIAGNVGYRSGITVDTGVLELEFLTYVGAELTIAGGINILAQASDGSTWAAGNFLNTAWGEITTAEGFEGLALTFDSATVPEPASVVILVLSGLALAARRRAGV